MNTRNRVETIYKNFMENKICFSEALGSLFGIFIGIVLYYIIWSAIIFFLYKKIFLIFNLPILSYFDVLIIYCILNIVLNFIVNKCKYLKKRSK